MKKFICILLAISLMVPLFAQTIVYADSYEACTVHGNNHDFFHSYTLNVTHPHEGFFECDCGELLEADAIIESDCELCREILCNAGLHYYLNDISFASNAYGKCYCGKEIVINCSQDQYNKHVYYTSQGYVVDGCPVCEIGNEYYNDYENFVLSYALDYVPSYYQTVEEESFITHTENSHDNSPSTSYYVEHPHKGWYECSCGKFSYFNSYLAYNCDECHEILCTNNIHYYAKNISYSDGIVSVLCCYCDSTIYIPCNYIEVVEHTNHSGGYSECSLCGLMRDFWINYDEFNALNLGNLVWEDERTYYEEELNIPDISTPIIPVYDIQAFNSHTCSLTGKSHDFSSMYTCDATHPHKGYFECECGEKLHFEHKIEDTCNECIMELCKFGIHNYSHLIHYTNFPSGYGECICGATKDFSIAVNEYNALGIDNSNEKYSIPCPECTFRTIWENQILRWELNNLLNMSSMIYSNDDINYANTHYINALSYTCIFGCSHGSNYLEKSKPINTPVQKPTSEVIKPSTPSTPQTNNTSNNTNISDKKEESITPLIPYYEYDLPEFTNMQSIELPNRDYKDAINDVASQLFLGNYSEKVTTGGTIAEIIFSLTGFDLYKDVTDLVYNFTHWEFTWSHVGNTFLNALAVLPIIGAVKNADEFTLLNKLSKLDPDTVKNLDKIGGINSSLLLKLKKLNQTEVLGLMKKLDGHALTKHVGNTSEAALKSLRKGTNAISSFHTQDEAVKAVTAALKDPDVMAKIAYKMSLQDTAKFPVDFDVGKTIGVKIPKDSNNIVNCTKIRVIIQQTSETEFYIKTAFPI